MSDGEQFEDLRTWLGRAVLLLRREPDLQLRIAGTLLLTPLFLSGLSVLENSFSPEHVLAGLGWGVVAGIFVAAVFLEDRMETLFPEYGDDEEDAEDSVRARYVRGEIDHETFKRRLDERLGAPAVDEPLGVDGIDGEGAVADADDPVRLLRARYARGEIDDEEYRHRLETLQETGERTDEQLTERN